MGGAKAGFGAKTVTDVMASNMASSFSSCSQTSYNANVIKVCQGDNSAAIVRANQKNDGKASMTCTLDSSIVSQITTDITNDITAVLAATSEGALSKEAASDMLVNISDSIDESIVSKTLQEVYQTSINSNKAVVGCDQSGVPNNSFLFLDMDQENAVDFMAKSALKSTTQQAAALTVANTIAGDLSATAKSGLSALMDDIAAALQSVFLVIIVIVLVIVGVIGGVVILPMLKGSK